MLWEASMWLLYRKPAPTMARSFNEHRLPFARRERHEASDWFGAGVDTMVADAGGDADGHAGLQLDPVAVKAVPARS
jgi:hypothetical protein